MDSPDTERKRRKRPTIEYYCIPAFRGSKGQAHSFEKEENFVLKDNNNRYDNQNNKVMYKVAHSKESSSTSSCKTVDSVSTNCLHHNKAFIYQEEELFSRASRGHRQISVDLSSLKNVVHKHINVEILSHRLQKQIRMNKYLSWHRPSELKVLFKAYKNDCTKEEYLHVLKIILKDVFMGRDINLSAEFCCVLFEKDAHKGKGERLCIQTLLIALEDLVLDYNSSNLIEENWMKYLRFLAELFFFTEENINVCSLYMLPLISHALNVTSLNDNC